MVLTTILLMVYCALNGTRIVNVFNPEGEGVLMSYHTPTNIQMSGLNATTASPLMERGDTAMMSTEGSVVEQSYGSRQENLFFHVLMLLASCYSAMLLTNWDISLATAGEFGTAADDGGISLWIKISSLWIVLLFYVKSLHVAYLTNLES